MVYRFPLCYRARFTRLVIEIWTGGPYLVTVTMSESVTGLVLVITLDPDIVSMTSYRA